MKRIPKLLWISVAVVCFAALLKAALPQVTSGTWTSAANLATARANASAALLSDGRILITGGDGADGPLTTAELFAGGSISAASPMTAPRSSHFSVVLQDGRVLVGGGTTNGGGVTNAAEVFGFQAQNTFTDANRQLSINSFSINSPTGATDGTMNINQPFTVQLKFTGTGSGNWTNVTATLTVPSGWGKSADFGPSTVVAGVQQTVNWTVTPNGTTLASGTMSVSVTGHAPGSDNCNSCPFGSSFTVTSVNPAQLTATSMTAAKTVGGGTLVKAGDSITVSLAVANGAAPRATANAVAASSLTVNHTGTATATCGASATAPANLAAAGSAAYTYTCTGVSGDGTLTFTGSANGTDENTAAAVSTGNTTTNSITVDNTAPATPSTPDMTDASDSGRSNTDNITNVKKPTFTGTEAEDGTTVTLLVDGAANGTAVTSGGAWTITAANDIADGTHSVTATATDAAGNVSAASSALSITIDTVANPPSTPDLDPASDSGSSNTDDITNVTKPKFNGTAEKNASVELFRGGATSLGTTTADGSGNWSLTLATALADGTYRSRATGRRRPTAMAGTTRTLR